MALIKGSFDPANSPDTDMMDMGWVSDTTEEEVSPTTSIISPNTEKQYPSVYLDHAPEGLLSSVKVGDTVRFTITGKIKRITTELEAGKTESSTCLEIHSMSKPKSNT